MQQLPRGLTTAASARRHSVVDDIGDSSVENNLNTGILLTQLRLRRASGARRRHPFLVVAAYRSSTIGVTVVSSVDNDLIYGLLLSRQRLRTRERRASVVAYTSV